MSRHGGWFRFLASFFGWWHNCPHAKRSSLPEQSPPGFSKCSSCVQETRRLSSVQVRSKTPSARRAKHSSPWRQPCVSPIPARAPERDRGPLGQERLTPRSGARLIATRPTAHAVGYFLSPLRGLSAHPVLERAPHFHVVHPVHVPCGFRRPERRAKLLDGRAGPAAIRGRGARSRSGRDKAQRPVSDWLVP
jgi:hypothetical protein